MATEVVSIIDPDSGSGYDYDSLYDWEAAEQGDLTGVRDEISIANCRCTNGTADTTAVTIDGWTTSATQYIKIWTDPAESYRHSGKWETGNKYRLYVSGSRVLQLNELYIRLIGLQINARGSDVDIINYDPSDSGGIINLLGCIILAGRWAWYAGNSNYRNYTLNAINCIIYNIRRGCFSTDSRTSPTLNFYNCTAFDFCSDNLYGGFYYDQASETRRIVNCIAFKHTSSTSFNAFSSAGSVEHHNIANDASANGTGSIDNAVAADLFVDPDNDDFKIRSGSVAVGAGANLYDDSYYPFQDDIDGDDRGGSGESWDIGADEYVAAGGSTIWKSQRRKFQHLVVR